MGLLYIVEWCSALLKCLRFAFVIRFAWLIVFVLVWDMLDIVMSG